MRGPPPSPPNACPHAGTPSPTPYPQNVDNLPFFLNSPLIAEIKNKIKINIISYTI